MLIRMDMENTFQNLESVATILKQADMVKSCVIMMTTKPPILRWAILRFPNNLENFFRFLERLLSDQ